MTGNFHRRSIGLKKLKLVQIPKNAANLNPKYYIGIQFHCIIMINVCDIECLNYITNFHDTKALTLTQASNFKIHCSGLLHSLTTFTL
jgi:hypothetical protein